MASKCKSLANNVFHVTDTISVIVVVSIIFLISSKYTISLYLLTLHNGYIYFIGHLEAMTDLQTSVQKQDSLLKLKYRVYVTRRETCITETARKYGS